MLRPEAAGPRAVTLAPLAVTVVALHPSRLGPGASAVRAALAAVDRGELARRFVRGPAEPLRTLIPPVILPGTPPPTPPDASGGEASMDALPPPPARIALLADSGEPDQRALAERLQVKLFDRGVRATVELVDSTRHRARVAAGDYDVALVPVRVQALRPALAAGQIAFATRGAQAARRTMAALAGLRGGRRRRRGGGRRPRPRPRAARRHRGPRHAGPVAPGPRARAGRRPRRRRALAPRRGRPAMTLRARLSVAFAVFAALPLAATLWPVSRALSRALEAEHAARLDGAAHAVEGELARLAGQASMAVADLAASPEAEAFAREHAGGAAPAAEEAARAAEWGAARGLAVLAVTDPDGRVISSAHLPGRAGDVDPELAALYGAAPAGRAVARVVSRAGPDGVEPVLALVAWRELPTGAAPLRLAGGTALGRELAARLAALTGGAVAVRAADGAVLAQAQPERVDDVAPYAGLPLPGAIPRLVGRLGAASRVIPLGPPESAAATVEVSVASEGLARARATVLLAFLAALAAAAVAAAVAGRVVASRVTRPVEALRDAAARVAGGDLAARVGVRATGEVGELVDAFNAMTADLAQGRVRLAQAERIAAWREVARRLAHEIKNPLTPIAMSVETLRDALERRRPDFPEIFEEGTRAISDEVRRLKRIVDEFSRFARLPAPERAAVAPEELVASALALFPAPLAGVTLTREVAPGLPPVDADRDQVLQVLLNLVRNALDALGSRGGTLRVTAARAPGGVAFTVRDDGAGIAPEDLARVFEPYFTTKEGGTGLGLAIARRIAEEHGGTLEAESTPGAGAAFTLVLPLAAAPASPRSVNAPART